MVIQYSLQVCQCCYSTITPLVGINVTAAITANITANNVYSLSVSGGTSTGGVTLMVFQVHLQEQ
jgi:hypothetical protein